MENPPVRSAWSVATTPRWISLTVVAVLATALCVFLAYWQGSRTQDIVNAERAALSAPVLIDQALSEDGALPNAAIGRPVVVVGTYEPASQRVVSNRVLPTATEDLPGVWVVASVRSGSWAVPVLRGWIPEDEVDALALPEGLVEITGVLQPYEAFYTESTPSAGEPLIAITAEALRISPDVVGGFVVLASQVPKDVGDPIPVPPTVQTSDVPFPFQNFAYTIQWLVFAGVVWFMWGRWLRLDVLRAREEERETPQRDNLKT
ncbi:MAG: SURF1 family protein [Candidatus Nanopelagicales bacterium]